VISRRLVLAMGCSQLVCWGISYYAVGALADAIGADLGWGRTRVFGGLALAWLAMGGSAPMVGGLIDRHGGRRVMSAGSCLMAVGCLDLSLANGVATYWASWICLGVAMRATLYDAAFATLARLGGVGARRAMAQVTLVGGLASTIFWPITRWLGAHLTWRGTLGAYAGVAIATVPLHLIIPDGCGGTSSRGPNVMAAAPLVQTAADRRVACGLYASIAALGTVVSVGTSAHMIGILQGIGAGRVGMVAALVGLGQSGARLVETVFGASLHPLVLSAAAPALMVAAFAIATVGGHSLAAAAAFTLLYGIANGVLTIARGTVPLVLFEPSRYGRIVGRLQAPASLLGAASPVVYAVAIDRAGSRAALALSGAAAALMLAAAVSLAVRFIRHPGPRGNAEAQLPRPSSGSRGDRLLPSSTPGASRRRTHERPAGAARP
jgi:hypothetical protein